MRLLCLLLLLAGCADNPSGEPGSAHVRLNGFYGAFGGVTNVR